MTATSFIQPLVTYSSFSSRDNVTLLVSFPFSFNFACGKRPAGAVTGNVIEQPVRTCIDHSDGVSVVLRNIQFRLAAIQYHAIGLAGHTNAF